MTDLEKTIWDIVRNGYVRAATGGRIPRTEVDKNAAVRPFLQDMKQDHAAIMVCVRRGADALYEADAETEPETPDDA